VTIHHKNKMMLYKLEKILKISRKYIYIYIILYFCLSFSDIPLSQVLATLLPVMIMPMTHIPRVCIATILLCWITLCWTFLVLFLWVGFLIGCYNLMKRWENTFHTFWWNQILIIFCLSVSSRNWSTRK